MKSELACLLLQEGTIQGWGRGKRGTEGHEEYVTEVGKKWF